MAEVTLYWRPGCPFCSVLVHSLDRAGISYVERNIWEDPEAAAFVRSVADGNETVPTVTVGSRAMVNPDLEDVVAALASERPTRHNLDGPTTFAGEETTEPS